MKYIEYINQYIKSEIENRKTETVLYGQNMIAGSCISGLTRGISNSTKCRVLNTPNIENAQVGLGFGLMLGGVSSVFFMKQLDFLLLGIDHLVNTYNFIRQNSPGASFTIVAVVVDQGYQGMQSSLNNLGDFCSIADVPGFSITNKHDAEHIFSKHLFSNGFRLIGVSQRLFNQELITFKHVDAYENGSFFRYYQGEEATIVCFNFSLPQGMQLCQNLREKKMTASLFSVNSVIPVKWKKILEDVKKTGRLIILDDSKSVNRSCYHLVSKAHEVQGIQKILQLTREKTKDWLSPNKDEFIVDHESVFEILNKCVN